MKIVHTADWHWSEQHLEKCTASATFIVQQLETIRPDLHVIAGDYWDRRQVLSSASAVHPALGAMRAMAEISPVAIVLGNAMHDAPGSLEIFRGLDTKYPIYVAERPATVLLIEDSPGHFVFVECPGDHERYKLFKRASTLVHLFPYPTKSFWLTGQYGTSIDESTFDVQEAIRGIFLRFAALGDGFQGPKIMTAHCLVMGASTSGGQILPGQEIAIGKNDLALARADYYALGHVHMSQEVAPRMHYAGSIYHVNFGEAEAKSFNLVEFSEQLMEVNSIEIPSRRMSFHELRYDAAECRLIDDNENRDWSDTELRIRVYLTKEQSSLVSEEELKARYPGAHSYKIERLIIPEERVRTELIVKARSLAEKIIEWARALEKTVSPSALSLADELEQAHHSL
jgi:exonuclease SbcD